MIDDRDAIEALGAVSRRVTEHGSGQRTRTVLLSRTYEAPIEELWNACTSAERIARWLMPISGDLRPGGRYQLSGNAGGTIERCDPPTALAVSWEIGGDESHVELRLSATGSAGRTRLELEHIGAGDAEKWARFGPGAVGVGWDMALLGLGRVVVARADRDNEAVAAWLSSAGGHEFLAASARSWCEAQVEAGAEPAHARESARNTREFYEQLFTAASGAA